MGFAFHHRKMQGRRLLFWGLLLATCLAAAACGRKAAPRLPGMTPPPVADLNYQLSAGDVILTWPVPAPESGGVATTLSGFWVYRAKRPAAEVRCATCPFEYTRVARVSVDGAGVSREQRTVRYRETLQAGYHYAYRVKAVGADGSGGEMSGPVSFVFE